jgi:flagellar basal-body rod protein FlgG
MANGLQIAASGLVAQEWRLDAIANDVANVNTVGYQQSRTAFTEVLGSSGGVRASDAGTTAAEGAFAQSDNPLAVAIDGDGYLQVRTAGGAVALTRDGDLHVDASRHLAVGSGARLDPAVVIPAGVDANSVSIGRDGSVAAGGHRVGRLTVVDVPAPDGLAPAGDGLLTPTAASGATRPAAGAAIEQGVLEQSNVDLASTLSEMIDAQRSFQLASRALHTQDQLLEIANGIRR